MIPFCGISIYPNNDDITIAGADYTGFQIVGGEVFPIRNTFTTPTPYAPTGFTDPGIANVRLGTSYQFSSATKVGNVRLPVITDVKDGVVYDTLDSLTGTFGDGTPPTFAGISGITAQADGSITASWAAATDPSSPITYKIYVKAGTATGLFSTTPFATASLSYRVYTLADTTPLVDGTTYYIGVRATDVFNNTDTNVVSMSAASSGVVLGTAVTKAHGVFSLNPSNRLQGTFWLTNNDILISGSALQGVANYEIFDATGVTTGITESGIVADLTGKYIITPVLATALDDLTHYVVKIGIIYDGVERIVYRGIALDY